MHNSDYLNHNSPLADDFREEIPQDEPEERAASPAQAEDVKRVFHPHSGRQVVFQSFDDYVASTIAERPPPTDPQPWRPFRTQLDFELAEFCEQSMLNRDFTETLISLIRRCMLNPDDFTLKTQRELDELWVLASHKCTEVSVLSTRN